MKMPVPFSVPSLPFQSQELLARARQYRAVAMALVDIDNGRPNWPKYTLLFHAIELALKAAIVSYGERSVPKPSCPQPGNHDLSALYDYATAYGLIRRREIVDDLPHISELHVIHYARYPQVPVRPVALISQYDDLADMILNDVSDALRVG
ncbi:hypothetical protein QA641_00030 [Bradyrhizobium sp. CB1650]|uniref:hypothetical protein n=1 Tax=Bradyrhizobium sp. CB1650 TaxID=3039153 RepID=UPI002435BAD2|nr:hypothetical protein [Bradyrhizobium sp. CB1650]WGD52383.1 hypothetical protein QA641_00030 [Bradyrhizobium sp. CB1650]